jgi:hypothetical protein
MRIDPQAGVTYVGAGGSFRGEDAGIKPVPRDMAPDVKGVYVGGCIRTGLGTLKHNANAHAHAARNDSHRGWVCFQHPDGLKQKPLRMHELAHIRTGQGHTDKWRAEMARLGQPVPDRNKRRKRS